LTGLKPEIQVALQPKRRAQKRLLAKRPDKNNPGTTTPFSDEEPAPKRRPPAQTSEISNPACGQSAKAKIEKMSTGKSRQSALARDKPLAKPAFRPATLTKESGGLAAGPDTPA